MFGDCSLIRLTWWFFFKHPTWWDSSPRNILIWGRTLTPPKFNMPPWKGTIFQKDISSSNHEISGNMLILRGVLFPTIWSANPYPKRPKVSWWKKKVRHPWTLGYFLVGFLPNLYFGCWKTSQRTHDFRSTSGFPSKDCHLLDFLRHFCSCWWIECRFFGWNDLEKLQQPNFPPVGKTPKWWWL